MVTLQIQTQHFFVKEKVQSKESVTGGGYHRDAGF